MQSLRACLLESKTIDELIPPGAVKHMMFDVTRCPQHGLKLVHKSFKANPYYGIEQDVRPTIPANYFGCPRFAEGCTYAISGTTLKPSGVAWRRSGARFNVPAIVKAFRESEKNGESFESPSDNRRVATLAKPAKGYTDWLATLKGGVNYVGGKLIRTSVSVEVVDAMSKRFNVDPTKVKDDLQKKGVLVK